MSKLDGVAIIGLAGRFPGAPGPRQFWENLKNGVESISHFATEELEIRDAASQSSQPNYVSARSVLNGIDQFDAGFFGIYPKEAEVMDPQHRVFLECCWEALEDAGCGWTASPRPIGVFAGCSPNSYFLTEICRDWNYALDYAAAYQVGHYNTMLGTIADTFATRIAYKLNLSGPAVTLLCACSTSLVAVCQACTSLLTYQCDSALAGGVSITLPQKRGYLYQPGGMVSPDGHCRPFDEDAQGTVFGSGAGVVLLKRLGDAVADRDHIYGVIKGFGINNDGAIKVGFTAPSVDGQASVIAAAQALAEAGPRSISYIEAHGTATPLGDPIEVAALTQVFRAGTEEVQFCALGTAKANVGHLDVAAGVTGLIKTALMLEHRQLPPTLHFKAPNPKLKLEESPFYVNTTLTDWKPPVGGSLVAGVSAFGVGGTNAHVVVQEAPELPADSSTRPAQIVVLSARSDAALTVAAENLARHLETNPELSLADCSWTLSTGRRVFEHRRAIVCRDTREAVALLRRDNSAESIRTKITSEPDVYFLFPGQGSQRLGMAAGLYGGEPLFRRALDACLDTYRRITRSDLGAILYAPESDSARQLLNRTDFAQPAIFAVEYALAQLWASWGIHPAAMVGHSVGEFVAACLAGVFSLDDALMLVSERGRLMQNVPPGAMLSVRLAEADILEYLDDDLSLAAVNAPLLCVVSGPIAPVRDLRRRLEAKGIVSRELHTSHAFHSHMMDEVLAPFDHLLRQVRLSRPRIPYVSCTTGDWITDAEALNPEYWIRHVRNTVRFSSAVQVLRQKENAVLLEVGCGQTLQTLARQHPCPAGITESVVSTLAQPAEGCSNDHQTVLAALASLWTAHAKIDWHGFFAHENRSRISLPTYPFERSRFWIGSGSGAEAGSMPAEDSLKSETRMESTAVENRMKRIGAAVRAVVEELSGSDPQTLNDTASFLELGFDSLFLTQVAQALQSKFHADITFRQLLDELNSIQAIAGYLDSILPPSAFPAERKPDLTNIPEITPPVSAAPESDNPTSFERIVKEQLQAMSQLINQQLEVMRGKNLVPGLPAVTSAPPAFPIAQSHPASAPLPAQSAEFKPFGPYKPVQRGQADPLTEVQRTYLTALIERYTRKTARSKELTEKYRRVLADPRVVSGFRAQWKEMVYPIVTNRSKGSRLWDIDGNEYIDILNGFGPIALGHLPDCVLEAARRQLDSGIEVGPQTPLAGEVAELLCQVTGMERATFCNTGSEAVMAAMRLARTVTGRNKVAFFSGDYHGNFDEVLAKRVGSGSKQKTAAIAPGIPAESVENVVVLEYGSPESLTYIEAHANELAAVLVEPVQSRHPSLQPKEFLEKLRNITSNAGTALIFDEIVTGFRIHLGGSQAYYGIRADLATYGKVLGGGFPIGAIAGSSRFMDALDGGTWSFGDDSFPEVGVTFFAGTFVRHPLALAAAKAVLTELMAVGPALQERLASRTEILVERLNGLFDSYELPAKVESCGSFFYFSFPATFKYGSLLYYHLREKGIHVQEGFPCFLTTAHTDADLDLVVRAFEESLAEMSAATMVRPRRRSANEPLCIVMTESQLEILLSAKLGPEANCSYNEGFTITLSGRLDRPALKSAIKSLLGRHEALKSTFDLETRTMVVLPHANVPVQSIDYSDSADPAAKLDALIIEEGQLPFDLDKGPLVRVKMVRLQPEHHVVVFTSHHIVCDGWSTNILIEELGSLYTSFSEGKATNLSDALPFSEYAAVIQSTMPSGAENDTEQFWLNKFRQLPPLLDLPLDRPRPAVKEFAGATVRRILDSSISQTVKRAGAAQGCTLFVTLLAGFEALVSRLTGQSDVVVGIPAAAQSLLPGRAPVGHCVNLLPLRLETERDKPFSQLLAQTRKALLDAYDHQQYTFGTLVRKLRIQRDPSRLPLIEIQFNVERIGKKTCFGNLKVDVDSCPKQFVNFDLFLNIVETLDGLVLDCDYNTGLFDEQTIVSWLRCYEVLLLSAARNIDVAVEHLQILGDAERDELLVKQNGTRRHYPRGCRIHDLFEQQIPEHSQKTALIAGSQKLSYEELNNRANQLAAFLRSKGVGPGKLVAVLFERSADMVVALLGILKSGGAYLPLDPHYPKDRLSFILSEAQPVVILTQGQFESELPLRGDAVVCLDHERDAVASSGPDISPGDACSEDLAYVIYTSGSTGKPKGVEVSHRAVVNFLCAMREEPGISSADHLLAVTTLSFDIAALEIFLPLTTGATVSIATRDATIDGLLLERKIRESGISIMQATPATWRLLLEAGWHPSPSLKMLCGGEALPRELADDLLEGGAELWNMYGPTETTIWSAVNRVTAGPTQVRVGRPIANTQFFVLDSAMQPQPLGVPGELYIGGDGLANGYFRRPELTREKFVSNPFDAAAGSRLYRTGDLVKACRDGQLEFLGRMDNQVKVRGFRIELGEIEAVLLSHAGIREVAVSVWEDRGTKHLVAYFTSTGGVVDIQELKAVAAKVLPTYMVPVFYMLLPEMPRTPNGKVNRTALPKPEGSGAITTRKTLRAPRNDREKTLAAICAEVLMTGFVGIDDNLFELGADSIQIFRIVARANRAGLELTAAQILRNPTVERVFESEGSNDGTPSRSVPKPIQRVSREAYRLNRTKLNARR